jgi:hypothetical protein
MKKHFVHCSLCALILSIPLTTANPRPGDLLFSSLNGLMGQLVGATSQSACPTKHYDAKDGKRGLPSRKWGRP